MPRSVLRLRWRVHAQAKNWALAFEVAHMLTKLTPEDSRAWVTLEAAGKI
jgi:hypothetical protein